MIGFVSAVKLLSTISMYKGRYESISTLPNLHTKKTQPKKWIKKLVIPAIVVYQNTPINVKILIVKMLKNLIQKQNIGKKN